MATTESSTPPAPADYGMPVHPVCALFPLMGEGDLRNLGKDVKENEQLHGVVVHEGQLLDGRNRLLVCKMLGIKPRVVEWRTIYTGPMSPHRWILSLNVHRRHLTDEQRTALHVSVRLWEVEEAARQRQIEAGRKQGDHGKKGGRGRERPLPMKSSEGVCGESAPTGRENTSTGNSSGDVRAKLAQEIGTSEYKVQQAINVAKEDTNLLSEVAKGSIALPAAAKQAKARAAAKNESAAEPPARQRKKEPGFNMERAIKKAMRGVDSVLEEVPENRRNGFLREMIKTLKTLL